jgi:hypothetical protein
MRASYGFVTGARSRSFMNTALWVAQALLAVIFLLSG